MTSTDDSRNSDAPGDHATEDPSADVFVEPVRRRSTYTPPPQFAKASAEPADPSIELPFSNIAPHAFEPRRTSTEPSEPLPPAPVLPDLVTPPLAPAEPVNPETGSVDLVFSDEPVEPHRPEVPETPMQSAPETVPEPAAPIPLPAAWEFVTVAPAPRPDPEPAPPVDAPAPEETEPPRFMTPDEEAATLALHAPPVGQPWIPLRRSLPDDELIEELVDALDSAGQQPGGTLSAMDALENEMRLREEEKQEYREWEDSMLAVGTPEALAAVAQVRPNFTNIVVPPELTPTEAIRVQNGTPQAPAADEPKPESKPEADAVVGSPTPPPVTETPATEPPPEPALTTDTGTIAAALFGADDPAASTITGQNEAVAALITEAATEAATAARQPDSAIEPAPVLSPAAPPVFADRPAFADPTASVAGPELDFDTLLTGDDETQDAHDLEPESPVDDINAFFASLNGPSAEQSDAPTGDEQLAGTDTPVGGIATGVTTEATGTPAPATASAVVSTIAVSHVAQPVRAPLFSVEQSGAAPTPQEYRIGRASRLFWLWFAANSSVVSIGFGAMVFSLGMSLRQSIMAILAGVAFSFIPLGLGTLAGKRSGQPAVVVSRASFGLVGNILPAALALVSRVFWGGVLLWLFASSIAAVLVSTGADGGLGYDSLVFLWLVVGVILAAVVAFLGYALFARVQLIVSVLSAVLIVGFVVLTADRIDVQAALTVVDGPWSLVVTGTVLVFSFVGLVWANSSSDLARYQRPSGHGSTSMLWASFGTAVPTFLLIAYGAVLAASDSALAAGLVTAPIDTLASILPSWYPLPLIAATALSLLSGVIVIVYSGAFALQGVGVRLERQWSTVVIAALLLVLAAVFSLLSIDLTGLFRDLATTLAVPVAAWVGIFAADTMIRSRRYHSTSLLRAGGLYPNVNWVNLGALVGISLIGWGLTTATVTLLSWQGYLFALGGLPLDSTLAASDLGVLVALVLGILTPIVSGIPAIRRQETAAL